MRQTGVTLLAILIGLAMVATGCAKKSKSQIPDVVDDWATIIAQMDEQNKSEVIDGINNGIAASFGYVIDTEEEKDALRFYDIYVTDTSGSINKEETNYGFDMAVRYSCQFDDHEEDRCIFTKYYSFDQYTEADFKNYSAAYVNDVGSFLDYLYEHKDSITSGTTLFNNAFDENDDKFIDGCSKRFTAEDFDAYLSGLEQ